MTSNVINKNDATKNENLIWIGCVLCAYKIAYLLSWCDVGLDAHSKCEIESDLVYFLDSILFFACWCYFISITGLSKIYSITKYINPSTVYYDDSTFTSVVLIAHTTQTYFSLNSVFVVVVATISTINVVVSSTE